MVTLDQRARFGLDTEQPCDEALDMRRESQQQFRLFPGSQRVEFSACTYESAVKFLVIAFERLAKLLVEQQQPLAAVKIRKGKAKFGHGDVLSCHNQGACVSMS